MLTSSGWICDVCGQYILSVDPDERVNHFGCTGIEQQLGCHNRCKETLLNCGDDWTKLPEGPLRKVFEEYTAKQKKGE